MRYIFILRLTFYLFIVYFKYKGYELSVEYRLTGDFYHESELDKNL